MQDDEYFLYCEKYKQIVKEHKLKVSKQYYKDKREIILSKCHERNLTEKGKTLIAKHAYKRRFLGTELINNWFYGCERHHINTSQIICIPRNIHRTFYHDHNKPDTMREVNKIAFEYLESTIKQL